MKGFVDGLAIMVLCAVIGAFGTWLVGCVHASRHKAATAATYTAEQKACVDRATSNEEANACRCEVKARYGNPCVNGVP